MHPDMTRSTKLALWHGSTGPASDCLAAYLLLMDHDVETLIQRRCHKVACYEIKLLVCCRKLMISVCISRPKTSLTDGIRNVELMELMGDPRLLKYRPHPCVIRQRVRGKVQDN